MVDRADPPFALWDGLPIPDAAGLDQKLAVYAAEFGRPMIHLVPAREATYQHVAEVMKILQRYGANIGLVGNEQFLPASPPIAEPKR